MKCDLGVGCEEYGVCYANSHNEPDKCGVGSMSVESKIRYMELQHIVQTHNEWMAYKTAQHQAALIGREADRRIEELEQELVTVRDELMYSDVDCLGDGWTLDGQKFPIRDAVMDGISKVLRSG